MKKPKVRNMKRSGGPEGINGPREDGGGMIKNDDHLSKARWTYWRKYDAVCKVCALHPPTAKERPGPLPRLVRVLEIPKSGVHRRANGAFPEKEPESLGCSGVIKSLTWGMSVVVCVVCVKEEESSSHSCLPFYPQLSPEEREVGCMKSKGVQRSQILSVIEISRERGIVRSKRKRDKGRRGRDEALVGSSKQNLGILLTITVWSRHNHIVSKC